MKDCEVIIPGLGADVDVTALYLLLVLYRNSPRLKNGLRLACQAMHLKLLMPKRSGGTRWLSHVLASITVQLKNFGGIRSHLETASNDGTNTAATAKGLAKLIADTNVVGIALLLKVKLMRNARVASISGIPRRARPAGESTLHCGTPVGHGQPDDAYHPHPLPTGADH